MDKNTTEKSSRQREQHVKSLRLLKLEKAIQNMSYPSVERLEKELEVSRRTILRDIDELKNYYDAPIEYDRRKKGYYYSDETFFIRNELVSESEVVALAGILPLLERYDKTPLKKTITKVYDTISRMLPEQVQTSSSLLNDVQFISDPLPTIEPDVFTALFQAIHLHKTITFGYRSIKSTEHTPHSLDPYKIYCQKGDWYVIGFCHKHTAFRTYNLSRMKNIVQTADFVPEPAYKEKIRIDPNYGIWNNDSPPKKIELVFEKSVNTYILERTWHKNQLCSQNADGSVCLSFESNQMQEVLHWILSFGSAVTVQNPPELKSLYCEEVKKMMEKLK